MADGATPTLLEALAHSPVAQWLSSPWAYPTVESVHLVASALLVGSIAVMDLRLLGFRRDVDVQRLARSVLPITLAAFPIVVASGVLLFLNDPGTLISNRALIAKLALVMLAGCNAVWFHLGVLPRVAAGAGGQRTMALCGALSLACWCAAIVCGRLIAYV
jgi:hypothetical protein